MTRMVEVWDVDADTSRLVPATEAAAGMIRYARRELGRGTPAAAEMERRAHDLLREAKRG